jgi:hypothetical protein
MGIQNSSCRVVAQCGPSSRLHVATPQQVQALAPVQQRVFEAPLYLDIWVLVGRRCRHLLVRVVGCGVGVVSSGAYGRGV